MFSIKKVYDAMMRYRHLTVSLLTQITLLSGTFVSAQTYTVQKISEDANIRTDRRPVSVGYYDEAANKTFVCWMGSGSHPVVKAYDHSKKQWSADKVVGTSPFSDKHNYPAMIKGSDGRAYIFYGCHNSTLKMAVSPQPGSIDGEWQDGYVDEAERASYPAPVVKEDGTIYVFYRDTRKKNGHADDRPFQFVKSSDNGKTWKRQMVIDQYPRSTDNMTEVYNGKLVYQPEKNGVKERIHVAWTTAGEKLGNHKHDVYARNVYYAYLDPSNDHMYNIKGKDLGATIDNDEADNECMIWDTGLPETGHVAGYQVSVHYRDNGFPLVYFIDTQKHRATSATWDGSKWQFSLVGNEDGEPRGFEKAGPDSFRVYRPDGNKVNVYTTQNGGLDWEYETSISVGQEISRCYMIDNYHPEVKLLLTENGNNELKKANRDVFVAKLSTESQEPSRALWMKSARWGVMNHYLADWIARTEDMEMDVSKWNELVDHFDVKGLADQLESMGVGYYIFTIGQNSGYYVSPNQTYDRLTGILPSKCSSRDLIADLAAELKKKNIKLIVYLPSGAPNGDDMAKEMLQWQNGPHHNKEFQMKWEAVIREWSERWGDAIAGWWFDGCYWPNSMYRSDAPPNFESFANAARAGNPNGIVAFNPGVVYRTISVTPFEDYIGGEISEPEKMSIKRVYDGIVDGKQLHILTYLGEKWGMGTPRFAEDEVLKYTDQVWDQGGAITWDVPIQPNGLISEEFTQLLMSIGNSNVQP